MFSFDDFLKEISSTTFIKFNISSEDTMPIYVSDFDFGSCSTFSFDIILGSSKVIVTLRDEDKNCAALLKYIIEKKYSEIFLVKEQVIVDILEERNINLYNSQINPLLFKKGFTLLLIDVDKNKYDALNVIKEMYDHEEVFSLVYKENIIVIGNFEEPEEHAESIKESILCNLYCKCFISYCEKIYEVKDIKKVYDNAKECMYLGKKFFVKGEIYTYNKILLEKAVYNIDNDMKQELLFMCKSKLDRFDNEMIITIEEFMNCGLNISDAAKKLYIHRNTLIYRLDKIKKEIGFDIRNFKEAVLFVIIFLVWKSNK